MLVGTSSVAQYAVAELKKRNFCMSVTALLI